MDGATGEMRRSNGLATMVAQRTGTGASARVAARPPPPTVASDRRERVDRERVDTERVDTVHTDVDPARVMTIEAFADTIIPGAKRGPDDRAIAGAAAGAVVAGAVELLELPGGGMADALESLAWALNDHAEEYAAERDLVLDDDVPAFVALPFEHRTLLVQRLTDPGHPEKAMWVGLALFSNMAFDSAAHMSTTEAFATGHPGLALMGFFPPDADGRYRFTRYSYGRALADLHPDTTPTGSPR
jgi:hypothetical protein